MNKLGAVRYLIEGGCDSILHGSSEYVVMDGSVVNRRGKNKPLDMKNMLEEGWDVITQPRWDTPLRNGEVRPTLCITETSGIPVIVYRIGENDAYFLDGEDSYDGIYPNEGELRAATMEEALALVADTEKPSQKPARKKSDREESPADTIPPSESTAANSSEQSHAASIDTLPEVQYESSIQEEFASIGLPWEEWENFCAVCGKAGVSVEAIRGEGKSAMAQAVIAYLEGKK